MEKLILTVDAEVLERARARAEALGTSVNEVLSSYLASFASTVDRQRRTTSALLALSDECVAEQSGHAKPAERWTRTELHER